MCPLFAAQAHCVLLAASTPSDFSGSRYLQKLPRLEQRGDLWESAAPTCKAMAKIYLKQGLSPCFIALSALQSLLQIMFL